MILNLLAILALGAGCGILLVRAAQRIGSAVSAAVQDDLALLKQSQRDLEARIKRGDITADAAAGEREDLRRRALALNNGGSGMSTGQAAWATPLLAALLVISAAGFLFFADPIPAERPPLQKPVPKTTEALPRGPLKDIMNAGAERFSNGDYRGAFEAYAAAAARDPKRLDVWIGQGEALVAAEKGQISPAAMLAFAQAEAVSPGNPISQYYSGLERLQQGDAVAAEKIWSALKARSRPTAPWMAQLDRGLAEAARQLGAPPNIAGQQIGQAEIAAMVEGLAARLEEDGDDPKGWLMLARSYLVLGRPEESAAALDKLAALTDVAPELQNEADALRARLAEK
ncbi:MAG: hypothetical protein AAGJ09_03835 [Pseudomonadota bacterium]